MKNNIYVVGNAFKELSDNESILNYDLAVIRVKNKEIDLNNNQLHFGLGVSEEQYESFIMLVGGNRLNISSIYNSYKRCHNKFTHKAKNYNVLISEPELESANIYSSVLMVDDRCAELSDHVTGKHIQYMVLVEAARQMVNAVTEKYYSDGSKLHVTNQITTNFINFVYPFFTKIMYSVKEHKIKPGGNFIMKTDINFIQFDKIVCCFEVEFTTISRDFIYAKENGAVKEFIANGYITKDLETRRAI